MGGPSFWKPATPAQVDLVADKVSAMASHGWSTMIPGICIYSYIYHTGSQPLTENMIVHQAGSNTSPVGPLYDVTSYALFVRKAEYCHVFGFA